jgi:DNA-binding protein YbaB
MKREVRFTFLMTPEEKDSLEQLVEQANRDAQGKVSMGSLLRHWIKEHATPVE